MAHDNQDKFCLIVKSMYPHFFSNVSVLDVGSMDINGNNKKYFTDSEYIGLDLGEGENVDVISSIEDYKTDKVFDVVISTEMLEHCINWEDALCRMYDLLKPGGLLLITCASEGRGEHGTTENMAWASPHTNEYYSNLSIRDISLYLMPEMFQTYFINDDQTEHDIQMWAIKK